MISKYWTTFTLILVLVLFVLLIDIPRLPKWIPLSQWFTKQKIHFGLDLQGGTELIYETDTSQIPEAERALAVEAARDLIERRVNIFGVTEPVIQTVKTEDGWRLMVNLPGIKNVAEAIKMIGETPVLEFKEQTPPKEIALEEKKEIEELVGQWVYTGLTGKQLKTARLVFNPETNEPEVSLEFNDEGAKLFADITSRNIGKQVAIFLDGLPISAPVVREAITGGKAVIA